MPATLQQIINENPVFLAPMAGINDAPFRAICKQMGAGLTYTEMISAASIVYQGTQAGVKELLESDPAETPHALQLFGSDPAILVDAAQQLLEERGSAVDNGEIALFDINMGCPVPKVVKKGEGSALMCDPPQARKIITALVDAVDVPVTAKIRSGWEPGSINAVEFAQMLQEAGASAVCVHPRTREQYYKGTSDWSIITQVKEALSIPVFGSGDIFSQEDIAAMFSQTGVDAVMVARGAQGNPWIFTGQTPTYEERIEMARQHAFALREFIGDTRAARRMRKHIMWYTHGLPGATVLRGYMNTTSSLDEMIDGLNQYETHLTRNKEGDEHAG